MASRALASAAATWPPIRVAFGWVHQAAHVLGQEGLKGTAVRTQLSGLLGAKRTWEMIQFYSIGWAGSDELEQHLPAVRS